MPNDTHSRTRRADSHISRISLSRFSEIYDRSRSARSTLRGWQSNPPYPFDPTLSVCPTSKELLNQNDWLSHVHQLTPLLSMNLFTRGPVRIMIGLATLFTFLSTAGANSAFSGLWTISATETTSSDPEARSSALDPWRKLDMAIKVEGTRSPSREPSGAAHASPPETMTVDTSLPEQEIVVEGWWDNRHIGAYLGGGRSRSGRRQMAG